MGPKVLRPLLFEGDIKEEVLELSKGEESRRGYDVDPKHLKTSVVEEERVLEAELAVFVGIHGASVLNHIDILGGPAGGDVRHDGLLHDSPVACEADK